MSGIRIAVLVSGGGTNLQALIDEIDKGSINGEIKLVVSSNRNAFALKRAEQHNIEGIYMGKVNYPDINDRTQALLTVLREREIDLVILAGYMSILDAVFIENFRNRIINVHPALIPSFCGNGFYGERVHQAVLESGVKLSGATVHFVDEGTDTGPIILQKSVEVKYDDTVETLAQRVLKVEHELLPKAVKLFCEGRLEVVGKKVKINEK